MQHLPGGHVHIDVQVQRVGIVVVEFAIAHVHESRHQAPASLLLVLCKGHNRPELGGGRVAVFLDCLNDIGNNGSAIEIARAEEEEDEKI